MHKKCEKDNKEIINDTINQEGDIHIIIYNEKISKTKKRYRQFHITGKSLYIRFLLMNK